MRLRNIPPRRRYSSGTFYCNQESERVPRKLDFGFRKRPSDTDRDRNGKRTLLIKYGKNLS